jgi:glycosyltransferase involved in cell wall biosynthesis
VSDRPRLLVVSQYWSPATAAGGARSTERAFALVADQADVWIVAGDRDVGESAPWPWVDRGRWVDREVGRVEYGPWGLSSLRRVRAAGSTVRPDLVYLPSLFAPGSLAALMLRRFRLSPGRMVIAAEGELDRGALEHHRFRKQAVLRALRLLHALAGIHWRAVDDREAARIRSVLGAATPVSTAPDLHGPEVGPAATSTPRDAGKEAGRAVVTFLSSIVPKKGLIDAIEILGPLGSAVDFHIYGPATDRKEWGRCERALDASPGLHWTYHGSIAHDDVPSVLGESDVLLLPTRGENYGYVVAEALAAGCPVLTSDQTPWDDLSSSGCGWTLPLDDLECWRDRIAEIVAWDEPERAAAHAAAQVRSQREQAAEASSREAWRALLVPSSAH